MSFLLTGPTLGRCDTCHEYREIVTACNQSGYSQCFGVMCEPCSDKPCGVCKRNPAPWNARSGDTGQITIGGVTALLVFNSPLIYVLAHNIIKYHT